MGEQPRSTLFPYTTLFRSQLSHHDRARNDSDRRNGARIFEPVARQSRSEEHTSELQSLRHLVCRLLLERWGSSRDLHSFPTRRSSDLSYHIMIGLGTILIGVMALASLSLWRGSLDRKSTRLNSSHLGTSYAVFCLKDGGAAEIYTLSLHDALPISAITS